MNNAVSGADVEALSTVEGELGFEGPQTKHDPSEFDKFIDCLPEDVDPWFIPVGDDKSPNVPGGANLKDEECRLTIREAKERLENGKNVGLYLRDDFAVMDVDDEERAKEILDEDLICDTLKVKSRSGKPHYYFFKGDGIEGKDIPDVVELRTGWRYVLVPGSCAYDRKEFEETGERRWGKYSVENAAKPIILDAEDLPDELTTVAKGSKVEVDLEEKSSDVDKEAEFKNRYGWSLEDIRNRENEKKLDDLLSELNPENYDYPSRSEADLATMQKLLYWEFEDLTIARILREFRPYEKTERDDYIEMSLKKAKDLTDETISDRVDTENWSPSNVPSGSWLNQYGKSVSELRSSAEEYHKLIALGVLSTIVGNKIYIEPQPDLVIRPNIWGIIIGPSTGPSKSSALDLGERISLEIVDEDKLPSNFTPQSLINFLSETRGVGTIFHDEFGSFIQKAVSGPRYMSGAMELLNSIFDGKTQRKVRVGKDNSPYDLSELETPCVSWLGSTMPEQLKVSEERIRNGFYQRFLFVQASEGKFLRDFEDMDAKTEKLNELKVRTREIHESMPSQPVKAEPNEEAKEKANDWRKSWIEDNLPKENELVQSSIVRIVNTYLYKFIILIKASKLPEIGDEMTFGKEEVEEAIELCEYFIGNVKEILPTLVRGGRKRANQKRVLDKVIEKTKSGTNTRSGLQNNIREVDASFLDSLEELIENVEIKEGKKGKRIFNWN